MVLICFVMLVFMFFSFGSIILVVYKINAHSMYATGLISNSNIYIPVLVVFNICIPLDLHPVLINTGDECIL